MISRQLELGFENQPGLKPANRSGNRSSRANWWFDRMRGVVNHAGEWPPARPPAKTPPPPAVSASAGPPASEVVRQPAPASPPETEANSPSTLGTPRWKFGRARRPILE